MYLFICLFIYLNVHFQSHPNLECASYIQACSYISPAVGLGE
uniref:Uncharacterized protein n=1 Tax=Anguilla anguilla TaxID=7936 RepID=A0A0E9SLQ2_ANGAN